MRECGIIRLLGVRAGHTGTGRAKAGSTDRHRLFYGLGATATSAVLSLSPQQGVPAAGHTSEKWLAKQAKDTKRNDTHA